MVVASTLSRVATAHSRAEPGDPRQPGPGRRRLPPRIAAWRPRGSGSGLVTTPTVAHRDQGDQDDHDPGEEPRQDRQLRLVWGHRQERRDHLRDDLDDLVRDQSAGRRDDRGEHDAKPRDQCRYAGLLAELREHRIGLEEVEAFLRVRLAKIERSSEWTVKRQLGPVPRWRRQVLLRGWAETAAAGSNGSMSSATT
jgi:hypothetical protein